MAITVFGCDGPITESQWSTLAQIGTADMATCRTWDDFKPAPISNGVRLSAGVIGRAGMVAESDAITDITITPSSTLQWHLITMDINYSGAYVSGGTPGAVAVLGTSTMAAPGEAPALANTIRMPIYAIKTQNGQITERADLRLFRNGGQVYTSWHVLPFHNATPGAVLHSYSGACWVAVYKTNGTTEWILSSNGASWMDSVNIRGRLPYSSTLQRIVQVGPFKPAHHSARVRVTASCEIDTHMDTYMTAAIQRVQDGRSETIIERNYSLHPTEAYGQHVTHVELGAVDILPTGADCYWRLMMRSAKDPNGSGLIKSLPGSVLRAEHIGWGGA